MRVKDLRNYHEAPYEYLTSCLPDGKDYVPVSGNGGIYRHEDGKVTLRLHYTDVITAYADGTCVLRNGGWNTVTTRQRLHAVTPTCVRIGNKARVCYVQTQDENGEWQTAEFEDGITLRFAKDGTSAQVLTDEALRAERAEAMRQEARQEAEAREARLREACAHEDGTQEHAHVWGKVERSNLAGTVHRKCLVPFCNHVKALEDGDED